MTRTRRRPRDRTRGATSPVPRPAEIDLDEQGRILVPGTATPVPAQRVDEHLARHLRIPAWASDIYVYVHGWQTAPPTATRTAVRLLEHAMRLRSLRPHLYPGMTTGYRPWCVVVRWPSSSRYSLSGYRVIRDRAHAMSAKGIGQAPYVLSHLLGYLHEKRVNPASPAVLANRSGQYLHLVGHSFGGRFLCEAVQRAAERPSRPPVLGWSTPRDPRLPFTVDSVLIFQMAAPRDAFVRYFARLFPTQEHPGAPLRGPLALTHSRWDRATGFLHLRAEGAPGIGHSGVGVAPVAQFTTPLLPTTDVYAQEALDHRVVNVNADSVYRGGRRSRLSPAGAHSDFLHPESAHLVVTLAERSR